MSVHQKMAWFNLSVAILAVLVYCLLIPFVGPRGAMVAWAVGALWALTPLFYLRARRTSQVVLDERDQLVQLRANLATLVVVWSCLVLGCMGTWAVLRYVKHQGMVSVEVLPGVVMAGMAIFMVTNSIAILAQYGQGRGDHE